MLTKEEIKKRIQRIKRLLKHLTKQLSIITDEQLIKHKLMQVDELNKKRIEFEKLLGGRS